MDPEPGSDLDADIQPLAVALPAETRPPVIRSIEELRAYREAENAASWRAGEADVRRRLVFQGAPAHLVSRVLDGPLEETPPMLYAREWERTGKPLLALLGGTQIGKTTAAVWLMSRRSRVDRIAVPGDRDESGGPLWTNLRRFIGGRIVLADALAGSKAPWQSDQYRDFERLISCEFLVIDDLGSEIAEVSGALTKLVQLRLGANPAPRPTVITSNRSEHEFRETYGERIHARLTGLACLFECGTAHGERERADTW